ncbi:hypothetical protein [Demequina subtropica]|uniref:hypothetical protein n=1 Tax=Demequina subtropica TaxID=1638989 RepID=UPI00078617F7|nr:hypothetical protein [Demequina subtropica]
MITRLGARTLAVVAASALAFTGLATAASAEDAATLTIGFADALALPAGDGVRDETTVTVTSDIATTVSATVAEVGPGGDTVLAFAPREINPDTPQTYKVPVDTLHYGGYELMVRPAVGDPVISIISVSDGNPVDMSLKLSASTIYSWTGATPTTTTASVTAFDELGLPVPFSGTVTAAIGPKTFTAPIVSTTDAPGTAVIPASSLTAGTGAVTATVLAAEDVELTDSAPLTLKRTSVTGVSLARSASTVYPYKDSYRDTVSLTVTPTTTTGKVFPATGSVAIIRDGKTVKSWKLTSSAKKTFTWGGLADGKVVPGTYTVKTALRGPEGGTQTATITVTVVNTAVKSVGLTKSVATVYPVKDSYNDTVSFTVTPTSTTGRVVPTTGKVTIARNGTTVKSWNLTSSAKRTFTWGGLANGAIVPGTYTVTVALKGPQGTTKTTKTTVNVSKKKLVTATKKVTHKAGAVLTSYVPFDYYYDGYCESSYDRVGDVFCWSEDAYDYDDLALMATGSISVPAEVVAGQKLGGASVKVLADWESLYGDTLWSYDRTSTGTAKIGFAQEGIQGLGTLKLPATSKKVYLTVGLGEYAWAQVNTFTAVYTYKKLV